MNRIIKKAMREKGSERIAKLKAVKTRLLIRFTASLALTAALFSVVFTLGSFAADSPDPGYINEEDISNISEEAVQQTNPDADIAPEGSVLYDLIGVDASQPIEILLLITIISIAPSILLMMTCFLRIVIVLGFLRNAMQTQQTPPNQVVVGLSLFLTLFIMWPVFLQINEVAYQPYADGEITTWEAVEKAGEPLKTFMLNQTNNGTMSFFVDLANLTIYTPETVNEAEPVEADIARTEITLDNYQEQLGFEVVIPAFMVSELSRAFQMGFMLFVPFLIIDIVVASTLMSMGMMMLPPAMISMPFKIMLFVLVNGWEMLIGSIAASFN